MPDMRGKGLPGIKTQPWTLAHPTQPFVVGAQNYPTGAFIQLARRRRETITFRSFIGRPTVIAGASSYQTGGYIQLARRRVTAFALPQSGVQAPAVLNPASGAFLPAAPALHFAKTQRLLGRKALSKLRAPIIINPALTPAPPAIHLARQTNRQRPFTPTRPRPIAGNSSTVSFPVGGTFQLARQPVFLRQGGVLSWSSVPSVVNPALVTTTAKIHLAPPLPRTLRRAQHRLAPPTVLGTATATNYPTGMAITLSRRSLRLQPTHSRIYPPVVVTPFVPPVVTVLAGTDWAAEMTAFF